jgi:hypothetical protein
MRRSLLALTLPPWPPRLRIESRPVDARRVRTLPGGVHRLAQPASDRRRRAMARPYRPDDQNVGRSADELNQPLADREPGVAAIPALAHARGEYGERFGLNASDYSKIGRLTAEGFQVMESAGPEFRAFSGRRRRWSGAPRAAAPVRGRRRDAHGERRGSAVPEPATWPTASWAGRFQPGRRSPKLPSRSSVRLYALPGSEDFATIYNLTPLYKAARRNRMSIAIVGQSNADRATCARFDALQPAGQRPQAVLHSTTDPGFTGCRWREPDLQWPARSRPRPLLCLRTRRVSAFSLR